MNQRLYFKEGAIGGLLGLEGGVSGTGIQGPAQADQTGMNNLQDSYNRLLAVAQGKGPNPAQAQYQQNVQDLSKQQSGALSSVQGISPALATRMISQQGSAAMQNAAAQGATNLANQQMNAFGQAANVAGTQAGAANQMQGNINTTNAGLAQTQMGGQQQMIGGIMQGAGVAMAAEGGPVAALPMPSVDPQSKFAQFLSGTGDQVGGEEKQPLKSGSSKLMETLASKFKAGAPSMGPMAGGAGDVAPMATPMPVMAAARGGKVPAMVSPGETYIPPGKVKQAAKGNPLSAGEKIPGKPNVAGNSYSNDTVPKTLESGGIVIPNSIMQSPDPVGGAKDFIANIIAKRKARK